MRSLFLLCILSSFAWPKLAVADPITVRTGDHDGFTRIVFALPQGAIWNLVESDRQIRLVIENHNEGFDLSTAFSRISRSRILDMAGSQNELSLTRNCLCPADVFQESGDLLVIDIKDPVKEPFTPEPQQEQSSSGSSTLSLSSFNFGELLWNQPFPMSPKKDNAPTEEPEKVAEIREPGSDSAILGEALQNLSVEIGSATTRGILTPALSVPDPADPDARQDEASSPEVPVELNQPDDFPSSNIRVTSSQDLPIASGESPISQMGRVCPDPSYFAIETWGGEHSFNDEVGEARSALFNEFDDARGSAVEKLAKLYLHYGFGAEASKTVKDFADNANDFQYLQSLAEIIDSGSLERPDTLSEFRDCESNVALWAILADRALDPSKSIEANAALQAFEKLPQHLRQHIGPILITRLSELEHNEQALAVSRNLERVHFQENSTASLARTRASIPTEHIINSNMTLEEVADSNSPYAPIALIRYVDQSLEADQPVPADIALLVEAYSIELSDDPLGSEMKRAHILASAKSGQFSKAFNAIDRSGNSFDTDQVTDIRSIVVSQLVSESTDAEYTMLYFSELLDPGKKVDQSVAIDAAARAFELGFADESAALMTTVPEARDTDKGAILLAELALERKEPLLAMQLLEQKTSPEAALILAKALFQTGAVSQAYQLLQDSGQQEEATIGAWLSDQWQSVILADTPVFEEALRVSGRDLVEIQTDDGMLSESQAALEESLQAREELSRLLDTLPDPG